MDCLSDMNEPMQGLSARRGPIVAPGAEDAVAKLDDLMLHLLMGSVYDGKAADLCAQLRRRDLPNGCVAEPILTEDREALLVYQVVKDRLVRGYAVTPEQCEEIARKL